MLTNLASILNCENGQTSGLSVNDSSSSSAFSVCNSDRSGEVPTTSSESRRLFLSCAVENSDDLIRYLVSHLDSSSCSIDEQKQACSYPRTTPRIGSKSLTPAPSNRFIRSSPPRARSNLRLETLPLRREQGADCFFWRARLNRSLER